MAGLDGIIFEEGFKVDARDTRSASSVVAGESVNDDALLVELASEKVDAVDGLYIAFLDAAEEYDRDENEEGVDIEESEAMNTKTLAH